MRHRGTIGGSIAHSDPASDLPATTLALGATYVAQGPNGTREIAAADFFTGFLESALAADELLTEIRVPRCRAPDGATRSSTGVRRTGRSSGSRRGGNDRASACSTWAPPRCSRERLVGTRGGASVGDAAEQAAADAEPQADLNASVEYRVHLAKVLVRARWSKPRPEPSPVDSRAWNIDDSADPA